MLSTHPSKDIVGTRGNQLKSKCIVLCITGSVAAVQCPEIARALMRHGANVFAVLSPMAQEIIHPYVMEWATGNNVVAELTGKIEHVSLVGEHAEKADLVLVAPVTANTISKIACGIDDTTVTSVVSTAFGSKIPIIIVPAMHQSMYNHPIVTENIKKLKGLGVEFVGPRIEERKAKIADTKEIVDAVIRRLVRQDFSGVEGTGYSRINCRTYRPHSCCHQHKFWKNGSCNCRGSTKPRRRGNNCLWVRDRLFFHQMPA